MSLTNGIVRRGGCHWRTGLSGEADHIESGEMLEECSEVDPGGIFDDIELLTDGSDDLVKRSGSLCFEIAPHRSPGFVEVIVAARFEIEQHAGAVLKRCKNGLREPFYAHSYAKLMLAGVTAQVPGGDLGKSGTSKQTAVQQP